MSASNDLFWGDAAQWISTIAANTDKLTFKLTPGSGVEAFALQLQNGEVLCDLLNVLHEEATPSTNILRGTNLKSFQCSLNAKAFLAGCAMVFDWQMEHMFEPDDLYMGSRFERVVAVLSRMSHTPKAEKLGFADLQPFPSIQVVRPVYQTSEADENQPVSRESIYGDVTKAIANSRRRCNHSSGSTGSSHLYTGIPAFRETPLDEGHENYEDAMKLLDQLYDHGGDSIYDSIVHTRSQSAMSRRDTQTSDKRENILNELRETERCYLDGLMAIHKSYFVPMTQLSVSMNLGITNADVATIFGNLASIIPLHKNLFHRLNKLEETGAVFVDAKDQFLAYANYCAGLAGAQSLLDALLKKKEFKLQLHQLRESSPGRFDLKSLLCLPMQRVLRYPLLLSDLLKNTPKSHSSYNALSDAVNTVKDIAKYINEFSRDTQMIKECAEVDASLKDYPFDHYNTGVVGFGRLLLDSEVKIKAMGTTEKDKKEKKEKCYVFAFEKALVVTVADRRQFQFKYVLELRHFTVQPIQHKGRDVALTLTTLVPSLLDFNSKFIFKTEVIRSEWEEHLVAVGKVLSPKHPDIGVSGADTSKTCSWMLTTFKEPTKCAVCGQLLWGRISQGYLCGGGHNVGCGSTVHGSCISSTDPKCSQKKKETYFKVQFGTHKRQPSGENPAKAEHANDSGGHRPSAHWQSSPSLKLRAAPITRRSSTRSVGGPQKDFMNAGEVDKILDGADDSLTRERRKRPSEYSISAAATNDGNLESQVSEESIPSFVPEDSAAVHPRSYENDAIDSSAENLGHDKDDYENFDADTWAPPRPVKNTINRPRSAYSNVLVTADEWQLNPWYAGKMSRSDAIAKFEGEPKGAFLIRESNRDGRQGTFIIDVCIGNDVKHVPIEKDKETGTYYVSRRRKFGSIPELVNHYQEHTLEKHFPLIQTSLVKIVETQ